MQSQDYSTLLAYDTENPNCFAQHNRARLPANWILIDSCSNVNLAYDKSLLSDMHNPGHSIAVNCNAGRINLTKQGKMGNYPAPVWFHPRGIANIMSMADIAKHYRLTMDTKEQNCIKLHRPDGTAVAFTPTDNGLYKYEMQKGETAQGFWNFLETVADRSKPYTKREIKQAKEARWLQNIIMRPGIWDMKSKALSFLRHCPITPKDVDVVEFIFGPNLGASKGKTVRKKIPPYQTGVYGIPPEIIDSHPSFKMAIDIMFINNIPFLVSTTRKLHLTTVEAIPDRKVETLKRKTAAKLRMYQERGFKISTIHADPEFEPMREKFPTMHVCGADDHVPDIERHIRTIKDRTRSTYQMLPFTHIPRIMLVHLAKNAVFWLNAFPPKDGILSTLSPGEIKTGQSLQYNKHARLEFGQYVQTHEKHSSGMEERTAGAICLGPTGDQHGGHWFMALRSRSLIRQTRWTELPMPVEVIEHVSRMGRRQQMPATITFADRHGKEIEDFLTQVAEDEDNSSDYTPHDHDESDDEVGSMGSEEDSDNEASSDESDDDDGHDDHGERENVDNEQGIGEDCQEDAVQL